MPGRCPGRPKAYRLGHFSLSRHALEDEVRFAADSGGVLHAPIAGGKPKTPATDVTGFRRSPGVANELAVPRSMGGGRAKAVGDGREFLEYKYCFRCGFTGTFTDCMDNGIVSTMADSSTAMIAKQTFSNGV